MERSFKSRNNSQSFTAIVERHELLAGQRQLRICAPFVVTEFDFVNSRSQDLDHGPDFAAFEPMFWNVLG